MGQKLTLPFNRDRPRYFPLAVNLISASIYGYAFYFSHVNNDFDQILPIPGKKFTRLMYLTFCNLSMQLAYHSTGAVLAWISPREDEESVGSRFVDNFHFFAVSVGFPVALTVVTLFWGLYYISPDLLLAPADKIVLAVPWYNHVIHTLPLFSMVLDFFAWRHHQPWICESLKALVGFGAVYLTDVHILKYITNVWPYPIMGALNFPQRLGFFGACSVVFITNYLTGYAFNSFLHRPKRIALKSA